MLSDADVEPVHGMMRKGKISFVTTITVNYQYRYYYFKLNYIMVMYMHVILVSYTLMIYTTKSFFVNSSSEEKKLFKPESRSWGEQKTVRC